MMIREDLIWVVVVGWILGWILAAIEHRRRLRERDRSWETYGIWSRRWHRALDKVTALKEELDQAQSEAECMRQERDELLAQVIHDGQWESTFDSDEDAEQFLEGRKRATLGRVLEEPDQLEQIKRDLEREPREGGREL